MRLLIPEKGRKNIYKVSLCNTVNPSLRRNKKIFKRLRVLVAYLKPEEVMAGTEKVRTYREWEELLGGDFGKEIGISW
ncbi:MAG: hypothetical protein ACK456_13930 [Pseudanabaenaceae cyanobacterium]|jgi:hypothetical protein